MLEDDKIITQEDQDVDTDDETPEVDTGEDVTDSDQPGNDAPAQQLPDDDDDEVVITFDGKNIDAEDDEDAVPGETKAFRDLRRRNRELEREAQRTRKMLEKTAPNHPPLPPEPTYDSCGYDNELYQSELKKWMETKLTREFQQKQQQSEMQSRSAQRQAAFISEYNNLPVKDARQASEAVARELSIEQQELIVQAADKPALLVYLLGKNEKLLQEFAQTTDLPKFLVKIGTLQEKIKMDKKKKIVHAESKVSTDGVATNSSADKLQRLRDEAYKTQDFTKLTAYHKELKRKGIKI